MAPTVTLAGRIISAGSAGHDRHAIGIDVGGHCIRVIVPQEDAKAFAAHLYREVRVTVACEAEAPAEIDSATPPPTSGLVIPQFRQIPAHARLIECPMTTHSPMQASSVRAFMLAEVERMQYPDGTIARVIADGVTGPVLLGVVKDGGIHWFSVEKMGTALDRMAHHDRQRGSCAGLRDELLAMVATTKRAPSDRYVVEYRRPGSRWASPCAEDTEDEAKRWCVTQAPHYSDGTIVRISHAGAAVAYGIIAVGACRWYDAGAAVAYGIIAVGACRWYDADIAARVVALWDAKDAGAEPDEMLKVVRAIAGTDASAEVDKAIREMVYTGRSRGESASEEAARYDAYRANAIRKVMPLWRIMLAMAGVPK